jgi:hypothetical protein
MKIIPCLLFSIFLFQATTLFARSSLNDQLTFEAGPFLARYYEEFDGENPGYGNDGTIEDVKTKLVYSEKVLSPSINDCEHFFDIPPYHLKVTWEGTINVFTESATIHANFYHSWSHGALFVDEQLISQWKIESNQSKNIPLDLSKGKHRVIIEFHNHWHTSGFTASFTNYPVLDDHSDIATTLGNKTWQEVSTISWLIKNADRNRLNEQLISLPETEKPTVLFLSSRDPVNWVISNPFNTQISAILLSQENSVSTVISPTPCKIYSLAKRGFDVQKTTGRPFDYTFKD